jgi:hypothetical protein
MMRDENDNFWVTDRLKEVYYRSLTNDIVSSSR